MLPLHSPQCTLRRLRPSDLAAFQAYRTIPELSRYQGWSPLPDADALAFIQEMHTKPLFQPGQWIQLGIADATDALVGDVGLYLSADSQTGELGITLSPSSQGRGIATAAAHLALKLFFQSTPASSILGIADTRNTASIRLLERLGFHLQQSRTVTFRSETCTEHIFVLPRKASSH